MEGERPQEEVKEVSNEVAHRINFDVVDSVQSTIAHEKENFSESFEGKTQDSLLNLSFKIADQAYDYYNDYAWRMGPKIILGT